MRKAPSFLLLSVAVPALSALPVLSPPVAKPQPVTPEVRAVALAGVDDPSLRSSAGAASEEVSAEARADVLAPHQRGRAPSRPAVFTKARGTADFELLGVTWRAGTTADLTVLVRTHGATGWSEWTALDTAPTPEKSEGDDVRAGTEPLYAGPSDGYQVRIDVRSGTLPADVRVDLVDPGESRADASVGAGAPMSSAAAATGQPRIFTRAEWGADESLRDGSPSYSSTIKAGFVHHTASANGYSAAEVPKILRSIYAYHTKGNGWSDIGYNYLVDRFGRLWEGRYGGISKPVMGAHTGGFNIDTFAVSAIGNYDKVTAPAAMTDAISRMLAWKLSLHYRNPAGKTTLTSSGGGTSRYSAGTRVTIDVVSAHRNMGYTSCPGSKLYATVPGIRTKVAAYVGPGLVGPSVTTTATSARLTSGVIKSTQTWTAEFRDAATGLAVRSGKGTGAVDVTFPFQTAGGDPLPGGDYTVHLESKLGTTLARSFDRTVTVPGATESDATRLSDGSLLIASRTTAGGVVVRTEAPDGSVTAPLDINGKIVGRPGVGRTAAGQPVVAVRGSDNKIYVKRRAASGAWPTSWERATPSSGGAPAVVDESTEGLRIFARAADGTLWTWLSKTPGTWATGTPLGGGISRDTAVGATRTSDGALHVIVNGTDHQAWYRRNLDGRWDAPLDAPRWGPAQRRRPRRGRPVRRRRGNLGHQPAALLPDPDHHRAHAVDPDVQRRRRRGTRSRADGQRSPAHRGVPYDVDHPHLQRVRDDEVGALVDGGLSARERIGSPLAVPLASRR